MKRHNIPVKWVLLLLPRRWNGFSDKLIMFPRSLSQSYPKSKEVLSTRLYSTKKSFLRSRIMDVLCFCMPRPRSWKTPNKQQLNLKKNKKNMKRCLTSLIIREMQVKTTEIPLLTHQNGSYKKKRQKKRKQQVLARMWRNQNYCVLLVRT